MGSIQPLPTPEIKEITEAVTVHIPQYHVILLDDDDHTYEYVIEMLGKVFGHNKAVAFEMACEVDKAGFVIVDTTHKDRAELKQDQVHAFGADWRMPNCLGSMTAIVEPADNLD